LEDLEDEDDDRFLLGLDLGDRFTLVTPNFPFIRPISISIGSGGMNFWVLG
jgi:hypothetical protein